MKSVTIVEKPIIDRHFLPTIPFKTAMLVEFGMFTRLLIQKNRNQFISVIVCLFRSICLCLKHTRTVISSHHSRHGYDIGTKRGDMQQKWEGPATTVIHVYVGVL